MFLPSRTGSGATRQSNLTSLVRCNSQGPLITIAEPPPIHELVISNWRLMSASFDTCSLATRSVHT